MTKISSLNFRSHFDFSTNQTDNALNLSGSSKLSQIHCDRLTSSGNLDLSDSEVGKLKISGNTDLRRCVNTDTVIASGRFFALDCPKLGAVKTSGHAHFSNCPDVDQITASGSLSMQNTAVRGDVTYSGDEPTISQSKIDGSFECSAKKVYIQDSSVGKLVIKPFSSGSSFEFFGFSVRNYQTLEQTIELIGKNCRVQSIAVEKGAVGKIVLKNGAELAGHPGAREIPFSNL